MFAVKLCGENIRAAATPSNSPGASRLLRGPPRPHHCGAAMGMRGGGPCSGKIGKKGGINTENGGKMVPVPSAAAAPRLGGKNYNNNKNVYI